MKNDYKHGKWLQSYSTIVQYLTYISNLIYNNVHMIPPPVLHKWHIWRSFLKKIKNIDITEISSFLIYPRYFTMYCDYYLFYCYIIYISHFLSYISRVSLLLAYISSDSLSNSSSGSKCLIEYRFLFPLFWYITFFPIMITMLKKRSISVSPNIKTFCSSLKFR